jgi:hypothetical protein
VTNRFVTEASIISIIFKGVTITGCAVANLTRMAASQDSRATKQQTYLDQVEHYLNFREVNEKTKQRVRHYFTYGKRNLDTGDIFQGFPIGMMMQK